MNDSSQAGAGEWDHGSRTEFLEYYEQQHLSEETERRFAGVLKLVEDMLGETRSAATLDMADIGCGPGAQSLLWARKGHRVHGLDVNQDFLDLAHKRAEAEGLSLDLVLGSATRLPWEDQSMDVVLMPELLEHVADWQPCLIEAIRVLRPGGILYLSTTNYLCPAQNEFNLPGYGWYPAALKRRFEKLAVTTRPELANYAKYPAVNWFSPYSLSRFLRRAGISKTCDRLDLLNLAGRRRWVVTLVKLFRMLPPLRLLFHMLTPYTQIIAIK